MPTDSSDRAFTRRSHCSLPTAFVQQPADLDTQLLVAMRTRLKTTQMNLARTLWSPYRWQMCASTCLFGRSSNDIYLMIRQSLSAIRCERGYALDEINRKLRSYPKPLSSNSLV